MGPLRDNQKKIEPIKNNFDDDFFDFDTQPVDDELSLLPDKLGGGNEDDDTDYLQNTVPCDEFFPFGDAFETQMVDIGGDTQKVELCGETQMVDLGGETQMEDLGGETQMVELCVEKFPTDLGGETQVLDECESEVPVDNDDDDGGNETEVYFDTQVISVEDSALKGGNCTVDPGSTPSTGLNKESERDSKAKSDSLSSRDHPSGTILGGFSSIRAASIRASGFAARKKVLEKNNKNSCSATDKSLERQIAEKDGTCVNRDPLNLGNECSTRNQEDRAFDNKDVLELGNECYQSDQRRTLEEYDLQVESRNENSRKIRSLTARKLFMDDHANDIRRADEGMDNVDDSGLPLLFASEDDLGGLSYVDSQEPGELSQANALDVVDKIVKLNIIEEVEEIVSKGSTGGKSKPISTTKGTQRLAKKAATRIREGENGAFSWDDNLEDEGGGEFFQKKKELFFDNKSQKQSSLKSSRMSWCLNSSSGTSPKENGKEEEQLNKNRKLKNAVLSDSRLLSKSLGLNSKSCELTEASFKKNLMKEMDEAANAVSEDGHTDNRNDKDEPDVPDVGIDTQLAADAMEALQFAASLADKDGNETEKARRCSCDEAGSKSNLEQSLYQKEACSSGAGVVTRRSQKARTVVGSRTELSVLSRKQSKNSGKKLDVEHGKRESKRRKLDAKDVENLSGKLSNVSKMVDQAKEDKVSASAGTKSLKKLPVQDQRDSLTPVARRTRGSMQNSHSTGGNNLNSSGEQIDVIHHVSQRKRSRTKALTSETSAGKADQTGELGNMNVGQLVQSKPNFLDYPKRRRTRSTFPLVDQEESTGWDIKSKRSKLHATSASTTNKDVKKHPRGRKSIQTSVGSNTSGIKDVIQTNVSEVNREPEDVIQANAFKREKDNKRSAEVEKVNRNTEASLKDRREPSAPESRTPVCCATPINDASPICKGDEYHKLSCRKNLLRTSLRKEINSLVSTGKEPTYSLDSRRRRDIANVRVLFSRHLDADTIKQQKKNLNRLGASVASSMSDASHFVTDEFARTKNMLEAIAFGKPVVTHLWLESCGQASCLIDERSYILRDARKEREFGFSMPVSLARASQRPLLQGQRVLITPNTKPGKEMLASLVKAVNGLAVERIGRSALKDENFPDDLLVISCEEDYETCVPFLEKGAAIYSSELLLNGIVTQRLEYERHQLFTDNVMRTRSTIWLKNNSKVYTPVCRNK